MKPTTYEKVIFAIIGMWIVIVIMYCLFGCTSIPKYIQLKPLPDNWYEVTATDSVHVEPVHPDSITASWTLGTERDLAGYKVRIYGPESRLIDVGLVTELTLKMAMPDSVGIRAYDRSGNQSEYTKWRKK